MTIPGLLLRSAQLWGERTALIEPAIHRSVTFADFTNAVLLVGQKLRAAGLRCGDRVAILGDGNTEYLAIDYGVMAAGMVRVPLDPSLSPDELFNQVADSGARLLLTDGSTSSSASALGKTCGDAGIQTSAFFDDLFDRTQHAQLPALMAFDTCEPGSLASLNYTGGTSGQPKAVMLSHGNIRAIVQNIVMARGMVPGDIMVNMRPLWPIAAIIVLGHLSAGGTVVLGGKFDPTHLVDLLREYRAASTTMVPTHLVRILRDCQASDLQALDALRSIDMGAATIPTETFEQALDAFGPKIAVLYGLTEASWSCYQPVSAFDAPRDVRLRRMKSVGRPVFGCDVMIAGENGAARANEPGEILLRGAHIMQGYWKRPELTAEVLSNGWFRTGDLGVVDADGVLSIVGRIKEVIRTGGKSVQPSEVERALCEHPHVKEASVVGIADREWGEIVAALVVTSGAGEITEAALKEHCSNLLSPHKRPKLIQFVDVLPKSHYGKVQRGKVRSLVESHRASLVG